MNQFSSGPFTNENLTLLDGSGLLFLDTSTCAKPSRLKEKIEKHLQYAKNKRLAALSGAATISLLATTTITVKALQSESLTTAFNAVMPKNSLEVGATALVFALAAIPGYVALRAHNDVRLYKNKLDEMKEHEIKASQHCPDFVEPPHS